MKTLSLAMLLLFTSLACASGVARAADLDVRVDAREIARKRVHVQMSLAARPGPLTLVYAKWIPGEHGPTGPLESVIGLEIRANGERLAWSRDPLDMYAIRVTVPPGASRLEIALESGLATGGSGFTAAPTSTAELAVLSWNQFVLFPKGIDAARYQTSASLVAPAGWTAASALALTPAADGALALEPASLMTLIDSPVQIARHARRVDLPVRAGTPPHALAIAADGEAALEAPADFRAGYGRLVEEAGALFGSRPYRHYTWLVTLSDEIAHFGLEHHESSDDRTYESILAEPEDRMSLATLLGHEYVHAWNGKFRRPAGLLSPDYQKPMDGSLLWVYEGMTEFWGLVLPTRAGLVPPEMLREVLADVVAGYQYWPGTHWRPMQDTATAAQVLYGAPEAWSSSRRTVDYYDASVFLWLDVDAELRARSGGKATLDSYVARFYGGPQGVPELKPYVEQDVYATLAGVAPGDWKGTIRRHLDPTGTDAMVAALERTGWRLSFDDHENLWEKATEKRTKSVRRPFSLGLSIDKDDEILDTVEGGPAARAGVSPGMKLIAVNGRKYTPEILDQAIAASKDAKEPVALLVESGGFFRTALADYHGGNRFPHLTRIEGRPDLLGEVLAPRAR